MEKYIQEIRLKQWAEIIESANKSGLPRRQWLEENGITKDAFYYWYRKVRRYYAEQKGIMPVANEGTSYELVEVPVVAKPDIPATEVPAAIIRMGSVSVEINQSASANFMENLGRMIRYAL